MGHFFKKNSPFKNNNDRFLQEKFELLYFFSKKFLAKILPILGKTGKTRIYVVIWFGGGSVDRTLRFPGSAEPHRTSKFGRTDPDPERFGRSLVLWKLTTLPREQKASIF